MMVPAVFLTACLLCQTGTTEYQEPEPEINWPTQTDSEHYYNTRLPVARLLATPEWPEDQENPPLSARQALAAARKTMDKLAPYGKEARLAPPTLKLRESSGRWFWVIYFSPNDWRRFHSTFPVVVLMDGAVIEPQPVPRPFPPRLPQ